MVQIVLNFTFPPFSRLQFPLSFIFPTILSFVTTCCYIHLFLHLEQLASRINLEYLDDLPDDIKYIFKSIERIGFIIIFNIGSFLVWYYNIQ